MRQTDKQTRDKAVAEYHENKISVQKLAEKYGVSRGTIYNWIYGAK
jgi:transposase-like protein